MEAMEAITVVQNNMAMIAGVAPPPSPIRIDHRTLSRTEKRNFVHADAVRCINRDYLGPHPVFDGREFDTMFRISKSRFQRIMEDFGNSGNPFYCVNPLDAFYKEGISMEARLLLPLKTMAYGVPPHTFIDYFQMSKTQARHCLYKFQETVTEFYSAEYLRKPTSVDLQNLLNFHEIKHGKPGLFGSLDCMHVPWKNCPVAWQGSYKGAKKKPTIILEGLSDQHMWFWHTAFGYAGTLNDINILNLSPLVESWIDGTFEDVEKAADNIPFTINGEVFHKAWVLVDGIYPKYSRFVGTMPQPVTRAEKKFAGFQEAARKDIERAFGVLQGKWQCMARPIYIIRTDQIQNMASSALILHNMSVSDRVMDGDVRAWYNPMNSVADGDTSVRNPADSNRYAAPSNAETAVVGVANANPSVVQVLTKMERWVDLKDKEEYARLRLALLQSMV